MLVGGVGVVVVIVVLVVVLSWSSSKGSYADGIARQRKIRRLRPVY